MYSTIYWITRLDGIITFLIAISVIAGIASIFLFIFGWPAAEDCGIEGQKLKDIRKGFKRCITTALIGGLATVFIPTKNDAILIYAGGKAYEYVQSDTSFQKIPYKTTEYIKLVFQKEIDELKKPKK
jgi:hypothetical protein